MNWWHDGILVGEKRSLWTKNEDGECSVSRAIVCVTSESVVVAKKTLDRGSLPSLQEHWRSIRKQVTNPKATAASERD